MGRLRTGAFIADRDLPVLRELIRRWRHPNGLLWGMSVADYGRAGAWTESLGVIAPLQEMMLQSWDGSLRIFPAWPKDLDAHFQRFRAEGAFLVSAAWSHGVVTELEVFSEQGGVCSLYVPWPTGLKVIDQDGREIAVSPESDGRATFATRPGISYSLRAGS